MNAMPVDFADVRVQRISDGAYFPTCESMIQSAKRRCYVSMFIVDYDLRADPLARLDALMVDLAVARWRGADVKLLVGGSRENTPILESALLAVARAKEFNLDVRLACGKPGDNTHVKLVIADSEALSGSHNWSRGAFGGETQDSIQINNEAMAQSLASYFTGQWNLAPEDPLDVSS